MEVLVVGASRGIGLEFVRQYRAEGDAVVGTARSAPGEERVRALGATPVALDVADAASALALAGRLGARRFDLVIVNAGVSGPRSAPLEVPTLDEFDAVMRTNVLGPMRVIAQVRQALAPGAKLVVLSSRMGSMGDRSSAGSGVYRASKAAVNSVLKDAALTLAGHAVCVAQHPGWVRTDMGGAGADLGVEESVRSMCRIFAALGPADNGRFLDIDGRTLPW